MSQRINCEAVFFMESFELSKLFLQFMKFRSEPGCGVSKCDSFSFQGSQCVQGGRQSGVVGVDKVHGGRVSRGRKVGESV